jgi:multidrug resistance efflux pump
VDERLLKYAAAVLNAKAALCDEQHNLQAAQAKVEQSQRVLALAEAQLSGAADLLAQTQEPNNAVNVGA